MGFETCGELPAFYLGLWNWKHFLACIFQVGAHNSNLFSKPVPLYNRAQEDSLKCVLLWSSILCSCANVSLSHCVFLSTKTLKFALWKMNKFFKYLEILFLCKLIQIRTGNKSSLNKILKAKRQKLTHQEAIFSFFWICLLFQHPQYISLFKNFTSSVSLGCRIFWAQVVYFVQKCSSSLLTLPSTEDVC